MAGVSIRIEKELEEKIKFLMEKQKIENKTAYLRKLLTQAIKKELLDYLGKEIENKKISSWKAAEIAKIPLREMMQELAKRDIMIYDKKVLEEDLVFAKKEG